MIIAIKANEAERQAFLLKSIPDDVELIFATNGTPVADVYFDLLFEENGLAFPDVSEQPVFINAMLQSADTLPKNAIRINAWPGFLKREIIELATVEMNKPIAAKIMDMLNWKYIFTPDEAGFIAPRIIATIINEAYFGLEDAISTKAEIDIAMKLGTNYPYGPFEWASIIGIKRVADLLSTLAATDERYMPAKLLLQEAAV